VEDLVATSLRLLELLAFYLDRFLSLSHTHSHYSLQTLFYTICLYEQVSSAGYDVVYLARTPEEKTEEHKGSPEISSTDEVLINIKNSSITNISESWVADHAKHITRMLPGGMFVLGNAHHTCYQCFKLILNYIYSCIGIYVVSRQDIFTDEVLLAKVKSILSNIHRTLSLNKFMYGAPPGHNDRLIIHFSNVKDKAAYKAIDIANLSNSTPKPASVNFQTNVKGWQQLDCYYEFDEIYPVVLKDSSISVKEQFQVMDNHLEPFMFSNNFLHIIAYIRIGSSFSRLFYCFSRWKIKRWI